MVQLEGHATHYEILGISRSASREEIDRACVTLWYRHQLMRGTPLWKDLNRHIEDIHSTLLDPKARAAYDRRLRREPSGQAAGATISTTVGASITAGANTSAGANTIAIAIAIAARDPAAAQAPVVHDALPATAARRAPHAVLADGKGGKAAFRFSPYPVAVAPAMLFNQMVDWVHPENWQEMENIALLALILSVAMIGLMWSASRLLQMHAMRVEEGETQ